MGKTTNLAWIKISLFTLGMLLYCPLTQNTSSHPWMPHTLCILQKSRTATLFLPMLLVQLVDNYHQLLITIECIPSFSVPMLMQLLQAIHCHLFLLEEVLQLDYEIVLLMFVNQKRYSQDDFVYSVTEYAAPLNLLLRGPDSCNSSESSSEWRKVAERWLRATVISWVWFQGCVAPCTAV